MPKEYIDSKWNEFNDNRIKIVWNRESGYCQLATVNPEGETVCSADSENGITDEHKVEGGWYVDLDRDSINRLIKILRRARTQIYGKDE